MRGLKYVKIFGRFALTFAAAVIAARGLAETLGADLRDGTTKDTIALALIGVGALVVACFVVWERQRR